MPIGAGDLLTLSELHDLRRLSGVRSGLLVLHAWATIAGAMAVYVVWPSALTLVLAVAVIGSRQLGLLVLVHDAAHWRLFTGARANTIVARWLCAYPMWGEVSAYRRRHHLHHAHTQSPHDPDLALSAGFPANPAAFWREVVRDLSGMTSCARVLGWPEWRAGVPALWRRLRGPLAANAVVFGVLAVLGLWQIYLLLWLLPLLTWHRLASRVRETAEHSMVGDRDDPLRNTRTVEAGPLARAFLAPYWVNYHLEHHLFVFVPCWKLAEAHALLLAKGYGPRMEVASSYAEVLRRRRDT